MPTPPRRGSSPCDSPCGLMLVRWRMSLADYLADFDPSGGTMHLMHSTAVGRGAQIIVQGELRTRKCPEYDQELLYLFYGRPAYKPLPGVAANGIDEHLPMCLVIDPALLHEAVRILPFDSGGYARYASHTGPLLGRPDFELGPGGEMPMRLVRAFYDTNRNYYMQSPTADHRAIPIAHGAARAFARLTRDKSIGDDDRRSTIEIQISRAVPLSGALKAVVGPTTLLTDPQVTAALDPLPGVARVSYDTFGSQQPSAYTALLYDRVASFLTSEGVLS